MRTYLNTPAIYAQSASKVDRENGIISNIVVTAIGEAKGHNIHLNGKFIDDVVALAGENKAGIKARFGHPNICATALGTYLGRYKNYHRVGDQVLADLHLDTSAKKSPNGDLYEYVLDMAENNPDMFGASIAFKQGEAIKELSEIDGKKVEKSFATIKALYATDLVDSPAATNGLFEAFHEDDFASQVTMFLDEHPQIYELLDSKPEILNEFLTNYKQYKAMNLSDEITKLKDWISDNFTAKTSNEELSEHQQTIFDELKTDFENQIKNISKSETDFNELNKQISTLTESNKANTEENTKLQTQIDSLTSELNSLKATPTAIKIPADPSVSLSKPITDTAGKDLLANMPKSIRSKLKKTSN